MNIREQLLSLETLIEVSESRLDQEPSFPRICRLVYLTYPSYFLHGVTIKNVRFVRSRTGDATKEGEHYPSVYIQSDLVSYVNLVAAEYAVKIPPGLLSQFVMELEGDFSVEYLRAFPYVIRVVTGNTFKRKEYGRGFSLPSVEFISYEFEEIQGTNAEIVEHKLCQLPTPEDNLVVIVEDNSLELAALNGFPGPYVKSFFSQVPIDSMSEKLEKLGDTRANVVFTIGMRFVRGCLSLSTSFPVIWGPPLEISGQGFDPYTYYLGTPLNRMQGCFRHVIAFWLEIMLARAFSPRGIG